MLHVTVRQGGLGMTGAQYLTDIGVVAVGGNTWGLEVIPLKNDRVFEVPTFDRKEWGLYFGKMWSRKTLPLTKHMNSSLSLDTRR